MTDTEKLSEDPNRHGSKFWLETGSKKLVVGDENSEIIWQETNPQCDTPAGPSSREKDGQLRVGKGGSARLLEETKRLQLPLITGRKSTKSKGRARDRRDESAGKCIVECRYQKQDMGKVDNDHVSAQQPNEPKEDRRRGSSESGDLPTPRGSGIPGPQEIDGLGDTGRRLRRGQRDSADETDAWGWEVPVDQGVEFSRQYELGHANESTATDQLDLDVESRPRRYGMERLGSMKDGEEEMEEIRQWSTNGPTWSRPVRPGRAGG